jgi:hypothetical protein
VFTDLGYTRMPEELRFEQKKLVAHWYAPPSPPQVRPDCLLIVYRYTPPVLPDCLLIVYRYTPPVRPDYLLIVYRCTPRHSTHPEARQGGLENMDSNAERSNLPQIDQAGYAYRRADSVRVDVGQTVVST